MVSSRNLDTIYKIMKYIKEDGQPDTDYIMTVEFIEGDLRIKKKWPNSPWRFDSAIDINPSEFKYIKNFIESEDCDHTENVVEK